MTALDIKGDADDNIDADSALGTISDVTGTDVGSYPTDDMSIVTAGLRTEVSDEFQVRSRGVYSDSSSYIHVIVNVSVKYVDSNSKQVNK